MTKGDNLSGAYALNALSDAERAAHEAALQASDEARNEATELQDTAVLLGLAVEPVTPSADLRARLLAQIAVTPQLPATEVAPQLPAIERDATPGPAELKARLRWSRPATAIVSAAAAIALIVGGVAVGTSSLRTEPSYQASQLAAITAAPDLQERETTLESGEQVTVRWSPTLASSVIIVDGMDSAPADSVYQLWYIGESGARAAGFLPVSDGVESWQVLDGDMHAGDLVGVTLEPAGGSSKPTTDPIMVIDLA
jgi:anti-sigma-K factor RskA